MGGVVLGHHHHAGGILVEAVDDAGALHPANARKRVAAMMDQRVDQRSRPVAGDCFHEALRR